VEDDPAGVIGTPAQTPPEVVMRTLPKAGASPRALLAAVAVIVALIAGVSAPVAEQLSAGAQAKQTHV